MLKTPFSFRYWGYMKWASQMRERYNGGIPIPPGTVDVFNDLHRNWHVGTAAAVAPTPGYFTSAGIGSCQER